LNNTKINDTKVEALSLRNITAIILAGGKSTRMGETDKSMLPVKSVPMIQHIVNQMEDKFREILIGGDPQKYGFLGHRVIMDEKPGKGPLMGVYSCLSASGTELNFITACDIPEIMPEFIEKMLEQSEGFDLVMPVSKGNDYEPLYAIYRKTVLTEAANLLKLEKLKLSDLSGFVKTRYVSIEGQDWYHNINYIEDYAKYEGQRSG
jgi:molybdopterin-guanine dinucleotide biosynthesis protein A